jgi:hypothetical protein
MRTTRLSLIAVAITCASATIAAAQTPTYPPEGYSSLLFDPVDTKYVFRLNGTPWICRGDTFCKPIKIEGVAEKDLSQAAIEPLGVAGARYLLSYRQANFEKGKEVALSCREERCSKLDSTIGDTSPLGTFETKQGDRVVTRTALLRQLDTGKRRAQLLWCTDSDCSELPLTRDAELHLSSMGNGRKDGRTVAWLRDQSGAVLSCAQAEEGVSDQLACEKTSIVLADFPAATAAASPPPAPPPAVVSTTTDADRNALSASIDRAIVSGDFAGADRLLADATRRYQGNAAWPPLQQKLAKARAEREAQLRQTEARRLIAEARRFAQVGDFAHAEQMLQDADKQVAGFPETAKARAEIASMRTERGQRYRERYQYAAAIDQAFTSDQLWEAERLLAEYAQRFNQDDDYRARANRLAQLRAAGPYQARVNEARAHVATARQAMERGDFVEAERQLAIADRAAPGFPDVGQARAELSRRRIAAERQQDDLRFILAAIDQAFQRKQFDDADRAIEDGRRRFGSYAGWSDLQNRAASARRGDDRQANESKAQNTRALELVAAARREMAQGDFADADKALNDAKAAAPNMPEIAIARAELERAKADRARTDAEIRAIAASVDAALARKQYPDAERLIADSRKRYPSHPGWADLSRRVVEAQRAPATQTGNAPAPTPPPAQATAPPAHPAPPPAPNVVAPNVTQLVATAREAIKRGDYQAAEKSVAEAEKADSKAATVIEVRAELRTAEERTRRDRPRGQPPATAPLPPVPPAPGTTPPRPQQ